MLKWLMRILGGRLAALVLAILASVGLYASIHITPVSNDRTRPIWLQN